MALDAARCYDCLGYYFFILRYEIKFKHGGKYHKLSLNFISINVNYYSLTNNYFSGYVHYCYCERSEPPSRPNGAPGLLYNYIHIYIIYYFYLFIYNTYIYNLFIYNILFLFIYLFIYLYNYIVRPTLLALGWPRAMGKCRRPERESSQSS